MAAEIAAIIQEHAFHDLKAPVTRICLPDAPAPASRSLEKLYYPNADTIFEQAEKILTLKRFEDKQFFSQFSHFSSSGITSIAR
jgi:hypothetical protein